MTTKPYALHRGDSLEVLRTMADNSVDAIVCDPPYGLSKEPDMTEVLRHWLAGDDYHHKGGGFMGKSWDSFVPGPAIWREALRVLKPGGHLLAFFGTRTQDIGTLAIRLAGFEIRDSIDRWYDGAEDMNLFLDSLDPTQRDAFLRLQDQGDARMSWAYGSGFPKSMDVSKAIDKAAGVERDGTGETLRAGCRAARGGTELVGSVSIEAAKWKEVTVPTTDAARQWAGFGTALKPAHEPICVARKPLQGTVAANVLQFGTGALNIDACRVESTGESRERIGEASQERRYTEAGGTNFAATPGVRGGDPAGRFPANLIHDGSPEVVALFPAQAGAAAPVYKRNGCKFRNSYSTFAGNIDEAGSTFQGDTGSAARFFYCAKASNADRSEGTENLPQKTGGMTSNNSGQHITRRDEGYEAKPQGNHHPTVKPCELMLYLVRLVTPPGGVVLDPYMGSGTTGKACMRGGFQFIGIDKDADEQGDPLGYLDIAAARIEHELTQVAAAAENAAIAAAQFDLFADTAA
jgi:site-specific DNA-methyltransferase (adenine-specific)